jgi:hypothetical protein
MLSLIALALGALTGFVVARRLRRPRSAAQAASVARTVSAPLGGRKGRSAPELQRACYSEMVRHVRTDPRGSTVVPNRYLIRLHPDDLAVVDDARGWFIDGLNDALTDEARSQRWQFDGPADIRFESDGNRRPGLPAALAVDPRPPTARDDRPPGRLAIAVVGGATTMLGDGELTIGRGSGCDVVIDDTRVSRTHAIVTRGRGGWLVTDAGSSNGTTLNGRLLTPQVAQPIRVGDRIGIGPAELRVQESES